MDLTPYAENQGESMGGLKLQVRRWQDAASLGRSDNDILDVSCYLNECICHFEQMAAPVSSLSLSGNESVSALSQPARHRLP